MSVFADPSFWGLILGLPLSAVIALLTVYFQNQSRDKLVARNTRRFVSATVENTIASCELLLGERTRSGTFYFDLANFVRDEISVYLRQREHVYVVGDKNLEREVDSYFRKLNMALSRAEAHQKQIYDLRDRSASGDNKVESSNTVQLVNNAEKALEDNCNDIRMLVAVGRNIVTNIKV
ncbi:MAG: hypothetical protein ABJV27_21915 [Roseibium sp.]